MRLTHRCCLKSMYVPLLPPPSNRNTNRISIHVLSLQTEGVLGPKPLVNVMNKRFIREKGKTGEWFGWGFKG